MNVVTRTPKSMLQRYAGSDTVPISKRCITMRSVGYPLYTSTCHVSYPAAYVIPAEDSTAIYLYSSNHPAQELRAANEYDGVNLMLTDYGDHQVINNLNEHFMSNRIDNSLKLLLYEIYAWDVSIQAHKYPLNPVRINGNGVSSGTIIEHGVIKAPVVDMSYKIDRSISAMVDAKLPPLLETMTAACLLYSIGSNHATYRAGRIETHRSNMLKSVATTVEYMAIPQRVRFLGNWTSLYPVYSVLHQAWINPDLATKKDTLEQLILCPHIRGLILDTDKHGTTLRKVREFIIWLEGGMILSPRRVPKCS